MNPQNIRYTQETCESQNDQNSSLEYNVQGNIEGLQNGSLSADSLPPIRVFQKQAWMNAWGSATNYGFTGDPINLADGEWYSLDNRRLYAFKMAGITDVPVSDVSNNVTYLYQQRWQFSTKNQGTGILLC